MTSIAVTCHRDDAPLAITVTGLDGQVTFTNGTNGDASLVFDESGTKTFPTWLPKGTTYDITTTQPAGPPFDQTCTLAPAASGTIADAPVTLLATCAYNPHALRVAVSGLAAGNSLTVSNDGEDLVVTADGTWKFAAPALSADFYNLTLDGPSGTVDQECTLGDGASGRIELSDVTVAITCTTRSFHVSGVPSAGGGVTGSFGTVVIGLGDDIVSVTGNGAFAFPTPLASGTSYEVRIIEPARGQTCEVRRGLGTIDSADITTVWIACHDRTDYFETAELVTQDSFEPVKVAGGQVTIPVELGDGRDGACNVAEDEVVDLSVSPCAGRATPDAPAFAMKRRLERGADAITFATMPEGLAVGDEVLIIDVQAPVIERAGRFETRTIEDIVVANDVRVTLDAPLAHAYPGDEDAIFVQRVPHYTNVLVSLLGTLTSRAWDGATGGVIFFRANADVALTGIFDMGGKGLRGGPSPAEPGAAGFEGEGLATGFGSSRARVASGTGGGAGADAKCSRGVGTFPGAGGSGSHAAHGTGLWDYDCGGTYGATYRFPDSHPVLLMGSGGGSGGNISNATSQGGAGGAGGGIVVIACDELTTSWNTIEGPNQPLFIGGHPTVAGVSGQQQSAFKTPGGSGAGGTVWFIIATRPAWQDNWYDIGGGPKLEATAWPPGPGPGGGVGEVRATRERFVSTDLAAGAGAVGDLVALTIEASVPAGSTANVSFSRDGFYWVDATGKEDEATALVDGTNTFDLAPRGWSGGSFYYRLTLEARLDQAKARPSVEQVRFDYRAL